VPAAVLHPVWVAIYEGGGPFKHWALFVENPEDPDDSFIVHVQGSQGRFRYEQRGSNAYESGSLIELVPVGHVSKDNIRTLRHVCQEIEVNNQDPTWNCQDECPRSDRGAWVD
jgi:hypothetical protein